MGREKTFTETETAHVDTLNNENGSIREIARQFNGSVYAIRNKSHYRTVEKENYSKSIVTEAAQIRDAAGTSASVRRVQGVLKDGRLNFATQHIQWSEDWKKVVFTDEKRVNLDGPDGFQHYWHNLRKEPKVISRRPQDSGGVMVWGVISYSEAVEIIFIEGSLNAQKYTEIIENVKGAIQNEMGTVDFVLQDSTPAHNPRVVKQ
ncbi:hypothetical protein Trydic_g5986 [Trypoxylus dichotomus]